VTGNHVNWCTLYVTDTYGAIDTKVVTMTVNQEPNAAPTVNAGSNQAYTIPHDGDPQTNTVMVTLDGSGSSNVEAYKSPDGTVTVESKSDVLTYLWECPTANVVSTDATTIVPMIAGSHVCTLTVTDTYGANFDQTGQASAQITVNVNVEPNTNPVSNAGADQAYTVPHDGDPLTNTVMVTLDGTASGDSEAYKSPDGKTTLETKHDVLTYKWECPTANVVSTDVLTVVPMIAGTHTCTLTLTDTYGATHSNAQDVVVTAEPNTTPVANAGADQTYTVPHDGRTFTNTALVTLDGSATADVENYKSPDGTTTEVAKSDVLDYQWSCPTAGVSSTDVVTTVPMLSGTHDCTLTVTDTYGAAYGTSSGRHSDTVRVVVNAEPNMGF